MKKHMYRAVAVEKIRPTELHEKASEGRLTFGCDAAKEDWKAAFMDSERRVVSVIAFKIPKDLETVLGLLSELRELGRDVDVVAEVTGTYAEAFADSVRRAGWPMHAVKAAHVSNYSLIWDGVPSSHDSKAACVIAALHLERPAPLWREWTDDERVLRAYARQCHALKQSSLKDRNRLEALLAMFWPELTRMLPLDRVSVRKLLAKYGSAQAVAAEPEQAARDLKKWSQNALKTDKIRRVVSDAESCRGRRPLPSEVEEIQWLARRVDEAEAQLTLLEKKVEASILEMRVAKTLTRRLGMMTTAMLFAAGCDPSRFPNARSLLKFLGLNLKERSSGKYKGALKITKCGNARARWWLYLAALRLLIDCPVAKAWVDEKAKRSNKMKAIVALMRKLVAALPHLARGEAYDPHKLFDVTRLKRLKQLPESFPTVTAA